MGGYPCCCDVVRCSDLEITDITATISGVTDGTDCSDCDFFNDAFLLDDPSVFGWPCFIYSPTGSPACDRLTTGNLFLGNCVRSVFGFQHGRRSSDGLYEMMFYVFHSTKGTIYWRKTYTAGSPPTSPIVFSSSHRTSDLNTCSSCEDVGFDCTGECDWESASISCAW